MRLVRELGSSMSDAVDSLLPGDEASALQYRERWHVSQFSCAASDRDAAEAGVASAYRNAGLSPPDASSGASRRSNCNFAHDRGTSLQRWPVREGQDCRTAGDDGAGGGQSTSDGDPQRAGAHLQLPRRFGIHFQGGGSRDRRDGRGATTLGRMAAEARLLCEARARSLDLERDRWAPYDLRDGLGLCQFAHDRLGFSAVMKGLEGLWQVALNAGWMVPHESICWLSDRWTKFVRDAEGHLHAADGPAIEFGDGSRAYFWRNIQVPGWAMRSRAHYRPVDRGERSPVVRRCLIEIMTPRRFIDAGIRTCAHLTRRGCFRPNVRNDIWAAVESSTERRARTAPTPTTCCRCPATSGRRSRRWRGRTECPRDNT